MTGIHLLERSLSDLAYSRLHEVNVKNESISAMT